MAQMAAETGLSLTDAYQTSFLSVEDAPAKTDRILMEFPWFNLAKRPRLEPITFEDADIKIEVRPSHRGMATIWDKDLRSEEHTSELQSLMRISYAVFCLKKKI